MHLGHSLQMRSWHSLIKQAFTGEKRHFEYLYPTGKTTPSDFFHHIFNMHNSRSNPLFTVSINRLIFNTVAIQSYPEHMFALGTEMRINWSSCMISS